MNIFRPSLSDIQRVQDLDARWYFSAVFDVVLRRHGVVLTDSSRTPSGGFVCRSTPWRSEFDGQPLVFEGPLHKSVIDQMGLRIEEHRSAMLYAGPPGQTPTRLEFPHARAPRREKKAEVSDTEHEKWHAREFTYHVFPDADPAEIDLLAGPTWEKPDIAVGVRRGPALVLGVPLFDMMARYDGLPPYGHGYPGLDHWSDLAGLEEWLLQTADELLAASGGSAMRLERWPSPYEWALTVRHDVDRPLDQPARQSGRLRRWRYRAEIHRRLRLYRQLGLRSTWFWLDSTIHGRTMRHIASRGHEVALHTQALSVKAMQAERAALEQALRHGISGMSAHGGSSGPGHLGLHHTEWALEVGFDYGERIGGGFFLGRAVKIQDGLPTTTQLMLPGQHIGVEKGLGPEDSNLEMAADWLRRVREKGGHGVLMNHPDVHFDILIELLRSVTDRPWSATLADIARWGRSVQSASRALDGQSEILTFETPLPYDATLNIQRADRSRTVVLPAGTSNTTVDVDTG